MKVIEQYFHKVLFIILNKVILTFSLWIKTLCVTIQMKAIEKYFHVVLFVMLYKVIVTFSLWINPYVVCDHSNESYWAVLSCGSV